MSMAFINKLFSSGNRKHQTSSSNKCPTNHSNVCEQLFTFADEQVQVTVFRECDFRGRRLLFDSKSVTKVNLENNNSTTNNGTDENARKQSKQAPHQQPYVEISNGFGYILTKPNTDLRQLREMIFGSVAMTFRGTVFKIHNLSLPPRLVFSQVFPSPRVKNSSQITSMSLDHSIRIDDSAGSGSSRTSGSDQSTSDQLSTASDTLLVCRRRQQSIPLDVPITTLQSSLISSSGYGGELSTSSLSSGPQSVDLNDSLSTSFNETLVHRSLPTSMSLVDDFRMRHRRSSKLGLAISVELGLNQQSELENFLMQHIALIESILWRVRQRVETAYIRHQTFVSSMHEISSSTARWFVDFLTCSGRNFNAWTQLNSCDIPISIQCDYARHLFAERTSDNSTLQTLTKKIFKRNQSTSKCKCDYMEKFVKDLCELIENFDVKHTNFFLSTLMTGVLTHHLGWVATILPNDEVKCKRFSNPLVQQLYDLYGCVGYPNKLAHTIIMGNNQEDLINKFISVLTYFVRCAEVRNRECERANVNLENAEADLAIVNRKVDCNNIPSDTHSNAINSDNVSKLVTPKNESFQFKKVIAPPGATMGIKKSRTCLSDLHKLQEECSFPAQSKDLCTNDSTDKVLFLLGEDEKLEKLNLNTSPFDNDDFITNDESVDIRPSLSCANLKSEGATPKRAQSEEPQSSTKPKKESIKPMKYRYAGVKFNFQQHPQIFENYMKSKNIELSEIHSLEKKDFLCNQEFPSFNFSKYDDSSDTEDEEPLQTPSNASELESTSELVVELPKRENAKEVISVEKKPSEFKRHTIPNTVIISEAKWTALKITELAMPPYKYNSNSNPLQFQFSKTLLRPCNNNYLPNMALQGILNPSKDFQSAVKRDLVLSSKHPIGNETVEESVAIMGNLDAWEVNIISSHTYVIDKNIGGVPVGMSQLVANMLESLLQMWKLKTPPEFCLMHIEQKLHEFCMQSKAVAQMLLDTEFCTIELLTSTLKLEINDVPLLMAVASVHTPEVTQKYGLRFQ